MSLSRFFPFAVVLFGEWKWGLFGGGGADVGFCDSDLSQVAVEVMECGCEVCVVPFGVSCRSGDLHRFPPGFCQFLLKTAVMQAPMVVILPDGRAHHGGLSVVRQSPCFHLRVQVFQVLKFFHPAPVSWSGCQFSLCFFFRLKGFCCRVAKLGYKK